MAALTANRNTPRWNDTDVEAHPVAAGLTVFAGSLVCLNPVGSAVPGSSALNLVAVGRAEEKIVGDGSTPVRVRRGVFRFDNSGGGDAITRAEIGDQAFVVDDQTVAKTNGGGTRSPAGIIRNVDAMGVWIAF